MASTDLSVRDMNMDEVDRVSSLVLASFEEFIAPEYDDNGIAEFRRFADPDAIRQRVQQDHFVMVAESNSEVAGMIEIRDNNHVALLFVDKAFQRRGVARVLLDRALDKARGNRPDLARVTVNSSRHGVPAYEKLGFRQTGPEREVNGIAFIPMARRLV